MPSDFCILENSMENNTKVIVIGGGPAGMMAAGTAAATGSDVILIEKNRKLGRKLSITGKGRCNLTNACESVNDLIENVTKNPSFLYSAFYSFTNEDTMSFFEKLGVKLKIERGKRVFPESDSSKTIVDALEKFLRENKVSIIYDTVDEICVQDNVVTGVRTQEKGIIQCDRVILATGGLSYQGTGSTGDGLWWSEDLGHTVVTPVPSLVPLKTKEEWVSNLQGLSLKNIAINIYDDKEKKVYSDFGEMMFTHFGVTGPVILSASAHLRPMEKNKYIIYIDLKPALDEKQLDLRLLRDFSDNINKSIYNCMKNLLPIKLIDIFLCLCNIDGNKKVNLITKEERKAIINNLKAFKVTVEDYCPIEMAIITSGGVSVKEINPSTMESKKIKNLYFAGEIIDVDAYTGGFNLQIAFSTGYLAGSSASEISG